MANIDWPSWWLSRVGRFHYAWVIVGVLVLVQVVGLSVNFAAGVLVTPLADSEGQFGFSMTHIGASFGLFYLAGAALSPVAGWLGDRYGGRRMMLLGALAYCGVMILVAYTSQTWHLFLSFGLLRGAVQAIFMVPLMAVVSDWFRRRLGLGTGMLWAATGVGPAIMSPLLGNLLTDIGWRDTFLLVGVVAGAFMLLLTLLFRDRPSDLGLKPYGALNTDPPESIMDKEKDLLRAKVFNQHIRRTKAFWNLPAIHALGCMGHGIVLVFIVPLAVSRGVDLATAAWMLGIISLVSIPSRIITPIFAEKYGSKSMMAAALLVQGVSVIYLLWAQSPWEFFLVSAVFGIGFGGEWTGYLVINRQYFGHGPIGTVYGWQMTGAMLGHAFVSFIAGMLVDITGSYNPIVVMSAAASLGGVVVIFMLESTSSTLIPNWERSIPGEAGPQATGTVGAD